MATQGEATGRGVGPVVEWPHPMTMAIVHDWLTGMRGGEKVLAAIASLYPEADLFTLIHVPGSCSPDLEARRIITSWLNRLPGVGRYYRYLLPLMPGAIESLDLRGYDIVLSSSHCVAKGVRKAAGALHVCYCHTPMRYAWSQEQVYRRRMGVAGLGLRMFRKSLRRWDVCTVAGVDHFVANSQNVANRIRETYNREAMVIYPPVDTAFYTPDREPREDFYLAVGAMAPNKCFDHAVEAMRLLPDRQLVVIGTGQVEARLRRGAPSNVTFLGWQSDEVIRDHYRRCRALLFPGEEDFGIVPVEAMACGCPVIAYDAGGVLETVVNLADGGAGRSSGLCYQPQTPQALADAILRFEAHQKCFDRDWIAWHASQFSVERFCQEFGRTVADLVSKRGPVVPVSP